MNFRLAGLPANVSPATLLAITVAALIVAPMRGAAPAIAASAAVEIEETDRSLVLPSTPGAHWVWASDSVMGRTVLFDGDDARMLGMIDGGRELRPLMPYRNTDRGEIYIVETIYSRGNRGKRQDLVSIYDAATLRVVGDVEIPAKTADGNVGPHFAALLDDGRFFIALNQDPGTSVSVVDLGTRKFAGEIPTPGCSLVYPAGPRRFMMLCGDGRAVLVTLDESGAEAARTLSPTFFDAVDNPVSDRAARDGDSWLFTTYDGVLHAIDTSGDQPRPGEPWSLFTAADRKQRRRPGGQQPLAVHVASRRLYVLTHVGGAGSHKNSGDEVWVYDLTEKKHIETLSVNHFLLSYLATQAQYATSVGDEGEGSLFKRIAAKVAGWIVANPGADSIAVTQDERPLLFLGNSEVGALGVIDALTGRHLRDIAPTGAVGGAVVVP